MRVSLLIVLAKWLLALGGCLSSGCILQGGELGGWNPKKEPCSELEVNPFSKRVKLRIAANASGDIDGTITKTGSDFTATFKGHFQSDSAEVIRAQGDRAGSIPEIAAMQVKAWDDAERNFGQNTAMIMAAAGDAAPKVAGAYADFLGARAATMRAAGNELPPDYRAMILAAVRDALLAAPTPVVGPPP
jgi:hypothetical protein